MKGRTRLALGLGAVGLAAAGVWALGGGMPRGAELLSPIEGAARAIGAGEALTVVTWNLHYGYGPVLEQGRGASRATVIEHLERVAAQIRALDADIVALQEVDRDSTRAHGIDQLAWLRRATGLPFAATTDVWDARWVPHPAWPPSQHIGRVRSAIAVLSRLPLSGAVRHALPQPAGNNPVYNRFYLHRAILELRAELSPGRNLTVFNTHFEAYDRANCDEHARISAGLLGAAGRDVLFLGDLNSVPPEAETRHAFEDEPHTDMRQDQTFGILRAIPGLRDAIDAQRALYDEVRWHTFPAWAPNRRLDGLFYGEGLALDDVEVIREEAPASDHLPVVVRLKLR